MYLRMVGEAVANYRGDDTEAEPTMRVEIPVDANLPEDYIASERLRLEMYKQIAEIRSEENVEGVRAELLDRYGDLPAPVEALLGVARLRNLAREHGIQEIVPQGKVVRFSPMVLPESKQVRLNRLYPGSTVKQALEQVWVPKPADGYLAWATAFLERMHA